MPFILLGNIASSLKFELISRKIGLVFLRDGTWYTWTFSLPSTWLQLPWWKIVRCFKRGLHCTRLSLALKAQKLLEVSEVSWSFTCIFKSKLLRTPSRLTKSDGRNIKLRCYHESRNSKTIPTPWVQTKSRLVFRIQLPNIFFRLPVCECPSVLSQLNFWSSVSAVRVLAEL